MIENGVKGLYPFHKPRFAYNCGQFRLGIEGVLVLLCVPLEDIYLLLQIFHRFVCGNNEPMEGKQWMY